MIVGIHQPHYFPWLGFLNKIANSDSFVILDRVQLEKGSQMIRNRVLDNNGNIKYITISAETKDFLNKEYRFLRVKDKDIWTRNQRNALANYYGKAKFTNDILGILDEYFSNDFETLFEWVFESVRLSCSLLGIKTPLILQSELEYDSNNKKSDLVMNICKNVSADIYLSGMGASVKYLDKNKFKENGIEICFQNFIHPTYKQCQTEDFIPGLSILDVLFNCGVDNTKRLFWETISGNSI